MLPLGTVDGYHPSTMISIKSNHINDDGYHPSTMISMISMMISPNQVLTHAARAAAKQLNKPPLVAARGAREGLWLEQMMISMIFS